MSQLTNQSTRACSRHVLVSGSDVVLGLGPWSLVVFKDQISVLGGQVLGFAVALRVKSLVLYLALRNESLLTSLVLGRNIQNVKYS